MKYLHDSRLFKRKFQAESEQKPNKSKRIMNHLLLLLERAIQAIGELQIQSPRAFAELSASCGSDDQAKISFIEDRFEEIIAPWLEKNKVDTAVIEQFKENMSSAHSESLEIARTKKTNVSTEFISKLNNILAEIDVTAVTSNRFNR